MKRTSYILSRILKYGTLISTLGLIGTVLLQIFARFLLESAPSWTEEASRFLFIYAISFAAGLAMKQKYYVHLDLIFNKLSPKGQQLLELIIAVLIVLLFGIFTFFSFQFIALGHPETSPSMRIPMSFSFFSMFIMGISISFFAWIDAQRALKQYRS